MITVVGMGRKKGDLTLDGVQAIKTADVAVVKSSLSHVADTVKKYAKNVVFCDGIVKGAGGVDELNKAIANKLQSFAEQRVAFCVEGDGSADGAVQLLGDNVRVIAGVGLQASAVGGNMLPQTVITSAQSLLSAKHLLCLPTAVTGICDKRTADEVQTKLLQVFDEDSETVFSQGDVLTKIPLCKLCEQSFDCQAEIYVLPKKLETRENFEYYDCADILAILRGENGCPWDREQTHKSIIKNVIEEAYELANALQNDDVPNIVEELGDLLMQVLFHIEIGEENGEFEASKVYSALCRKLIDRHPHVFGEVKANNSTESLDVWNAQKLKEHKIKNLTENLTDVPSYMSALMRSQKIQSRASKGGYEFENVQQVIDKIREELDEFIRADDNSRQVEGGDLLFAVVNLLRLFKVDCETALLVSTDKFVKRVAECERILAKRGQVLTDLPMEKFDEIWAEAKSNVG